MLTFAYVHAQHTDFTAQPTHTHKEACSHLMWNFRRERCKHLHIRTERLCVWEKEGESEDCPERTHTHAQCIKIKHLKIHSFIEANGGWGRGGGGCNYDDEQRGTYTFIITFIKHRKRVCACLYVCVGVCVCLPALLNTALCFWYEVPTQARTHTHKHLYTL